MALKRIDPLFYMRFFHNESIVFLSVTTVSDKRRAALPAGTGDGVDTQFLASVLASKKKKKKPV